MVARDGGSALSSARKARHGDEISVTNEANSKSHDAKFVMYLPIKDRTHEKQDKTICETRFD